MAKNGGTGSLVYDSKTWAKEVPVSAVQ